MNKAKACPWIGMAIGAFLSYLVMITGEITDPEDIVGITFIFVPIIGCYYGWLMEKSKRALIIGGILGFFFGLHPVLSSIFIIGGPIVGSSWRQKKSHVLTGKIITTLCQAADLEDADDCYLSLFSAIISIIVGIICCGDGNYWGVALIIFGLIPYINWLIVFIASIVFGLYFYPLLIFPTLSLAGYVIGKSIGGIIAKREEYEQKIKEYKSKIEQWKEEGYDVSELEEMVR